MISRDRRVRYLMALGLSLAAAACEGPPEDEATEATDEALLQGAASFNVERIYVSGTASATNGNSRVVPLGPMPKGALVSVNGCDGRSQGNVYTRIAHKDGKHAGFDRDGGRPGRCRNGFPGSYYTVVIPEAGEYELRVGCQGDEACNTAPEVSSTMSLLQRWAPAVYQDVDITFSTFGQRNWHYVHDYLLKVNFDGEYETHNNEVSLGRNDVDKGGYVYTSKMETTTHYFLGYYFYHPKDAYHNYVNDLEGVLLSVRKEGLFGRLESWITQAHGDHLVAADSAALSPCVSLPLFGASRITWHDGVVHGQPAVYIEARGHGVKTCLQGDCGRNDGIIYMWENGRSETPGVHCNRGSQEFSNRANNAICGYQLIPMEQGSGERGRPGGVDQGLFFLLGHPGVYIDDGNFVGHEANTPWTWNGDWTGNPVDLFHQRHWSRLAGCDVGQRFLTPYVGAQPYRR